MRYVLVNPSGTCPIRSSRRKSCRGSSHFESLGYEVKTIGGRIVVRQPPGEDNALGRLAFMFPNDHSVYLHDTPAQRAVLEDMRALSHGCVRVEEPLQLAELVLGWPESRSERGDRRTGANGLPAPPAPDPHRIFHRIRRRGRDPAGAARRLWTDARVAGTFAKRVKIELGEDGSIRRSLIFALLCIVGSQHGRPCRVDACARRSAGEGASGRTRRRPG